MVRLMKNTKLWPKIAKKGTSQKSKISTWRRSLVSLDCV